MEGQEEKKGLCEVWRITCGCRWQHKFFQFLHVTRVKWISVTPVHDLSVVKRLDYVFHVCRVSAEFPHGHAAAHGVVSHRRENMHIARLLEYKQF